MLSSYFTENSLSHGNRQRSDIRMYVGLHVKVLQLLFDIQNGNVTNLCKNSKYEILWLSVRWEPSCWERQPDFLTDWLTGKHMVKLISLFGIALWTRLCALCVCVCVCVCVFVGVVCGFKPVDHFSWNLVWTLSHWSHTHHHIFSGLRKLSDNQQCGSCVNV